MVNYFDNYLMVMGDDDVKLNVVSLKARIFRSPLRVMTKFEKIV